MMTRKVPTDQKLGFESVARSDKHLARGIAARGFCETLSGWMSGKWVVAMMSQERYWPTTMANGRALTREKRY